MDGTMIPPEARSESTASYVHPTKPVVGRKHAGAQDGQPDSGSATPLCSLVKRLIRTPDVLSGAQQPGRDPMSLCERGPGKDH